MPRPSNVFANGQEIASKSTIGQSMAFPDVCFSPPTPPPPGVPIPYPNMCFARDISNGSRTVFIQRKTIAIQDKAYFRTSYGDEPATPGLKKGIVSTKIKGRCYFVGWSPNVKVEGLCVDRNFDNVTHNHGNPANTALFPYISQGFFDKNPCKDETKRIERECGKEEDDSEYKKPLRGKKKFPRLGARKKNDKPGGKWHWTDDHCDGLQFPNNTGRAEEFMQQAEDAFQRAKDELLSLEGLGSLMLDYAQNAGLKIAGKILLKAGVKQVAGTSVPLAGNIVMGLWTAWDVVSGIGDVAEVNRVVQEYADQFKAIKDNLGNMKNVLDRYRDPVTGKLSAEKLPTMMGDIQDAIAQMNACLRARKCNLVPYKGKGHFKKQGVKSNNVEPANDGGCCPGQTGHHLVPETMIGGSNCPGYKHADAPTVCVESALKDAGSHGRVHNAMDAALQDKLQAGKVVGGKIGMQDAIDAAVKSHKKAFPLSRCDDACIRAQLKDYYDSLCPNASLDANDKTGATIGGGGSDE
jgi:Domain of unknown function (DUF4150)/GHH signature containing HNH/Endo VII superfamily nuclease toxin  2